MVSKDGPMVSSGVQAESWATSYSTARLISEVQPAGEGGLMMGIAARTARPSAAPRQILPSQIRLKNVRCGAA